MPSSALAQSTSDSTLGWSLWLVPAATDEAASALTSTITTLVPARLDNKQLTPVFPAHITLVSGIQSDDVVDPQAWLAHRRLNTVVTDAQVQVRFTEQQLVQSSSRSFSSGASETPPC